MFDPERLEQVLDLQDKSYRLLTWVGQQMRRETLSFNVMHGAMSASEAAEEWIRRHYDNFPLDVRPDGDDVHAFAMLFSSFLSTSFEMVEKPRAVLEPFCCCPCCGRLVAGSKLKPRKLTASAKDDALALKALYLKTLAESVDVALSDDQAKQMAKDNLDAALCAYAFELHRRTEFASQGPGVLVLWREIAWDNDAPKKKFTLRRAAVLEAERRLIARLRGE